MKKTFLICAAAMIVLGAATGVFACGEKANAAKSVDGSSACCPEAAAKAAYDKAYTESGCAKTAKGAAQTAMASATYKNTFAETGCSKTATKAAYDAVNKETGCSKTAVSAATAAARQAAYDATYATSSCAKSSGAAAEEAEKAAGALLASTTDTSPIKKSAPAIAKSAS
ncbi:MAG: hypothetical protein K8R59_05565 [Thermoanaerobaculales bacterium]|nr:hypothetical protein [Thermoanaerobaculales bacterium]